MGSQISADLIEKIVAGILAFFALVMYVILFYLSIRNCFDKEKKKGFRLFVVSFFTNPVTLYLIVGFFAGVIYSIVYLNNPEKLAALSNGEIGSVTIYNSTVIVLWFLELFFAYIVSKWLKVRHPSLVFFVYQMFCVLFLVSLKGLEIDALGNSVFLIVLIEITDFLLSSVYMLLLYFLVIKSLANISDRPFSVSWRIFVLPPALFGLLYGMVSITVPFLMENGAGNIIYAFSIFISYIFIWAFYVIIKTITATAEALEAKDEVETLSVEVMEALAHTIDAKDEYTKGHSVRVAQYARMLAKRMGLPDKECENVYNMGLLHDIGKIGVPKEIINSKKPLSKEEFDTIKIHPGLGYDILAEIKSRPDLCTGARWHHERYDGGGYPDGKSGEDIPLQARIIAVADSYDAMTSNRSYRNYLPQEKVRQEMKDNAGTQFDPQIAEAMIAIIDEDTEYKFHE